MTKTAFAVTRTEALMTEVEAPNTNQTKENDYAIHHAGKSTAAKV
jgi:hypothetical protein